MADAAASDAGGSPAATHAVSITRRGVLIVLSSPSGAGKTTLAKGLMASDPRLTMSVSVTTRAPRPGERDGVDYHFISDAVFDQMAAAGELLEWAHVFDHKYGTPRPAVEALIEAGSDVLFDIDWQGAAQLAAALPRDVVRVFILPPSISALEARLRARAQDSDDVVARRMARARDEISHWDQYDYVIVNHDVAASLDQLKAVVAAEQQRRDRQTGLAAFVDDLA
ncbi:MAG: guanylate kinase [Pseudomonadota bacterium]